MSSALTCTRIPVIASDGIAVADPSAAIASFTICACPPDPQSSVATTVPSPSVICILSAILLSYKLLMIVGGVVISGIGDRLVTKFLREGTLVPIGTLPYADVVTPPSQIFCGSSL